MEHSINDVWSREYYIHKSRELLDRYNANERFLQDDFRLFSQLVHLFRNDITYLEGHLNWLESHEQPAGTPNHRIAQRYIQVERQLRVDLENAFWELRPRNLIIHNYERHLLQENPSSILYQTLQDNVLELVDEIQFNPINIPVSERNTYQEIQNIMVRENIRFFLFEYKLQD